jgi:hypothetical protein
MDTIYEVSHIEHRKVNTTSSKTKYYNEIVLKVEEPNYPENTAICNGESVSQGIAAKSAT